MKAHDAIVDTVPSFLRAVARKRDTIDDWPRLWSEDCMVLWRELFEMRVANYAEQGEVWR